MHWKEQRHGDDLLITARVEGGPSEVRAAARHLWAVFQVRAMPAHRDLAWDEVRVDLRNSGLALVHTASTTDAGVAARVVVGLDIPSLRDGWDAISDDDAAAERTFLQGYARAIVDALPHAGWSFEGAERWQAAGGAIVCICEGEDDEEALLDHRLLDAPVATVLRSGPFAAYKPIPVEPPALPISSARARELSDLASHAWVDDLGDEVRNDPKAFAALGAAKQRETERFLATTTSPYELHCFADRCSVEMGIDELKKVIEHPHCDAGTALSIYWRCRPEFYLRYAMPADVPESARDAFEVILAIERRYLGEQYASHAIPFDPKRSGAAGLYPEELAMAKRSLPPRMYEPV